MVIIILSFLCPGVIYNTEFITRVSQFRTVHSRPPIIDLSKNNNSRVCRKCKIDDSGNVGLSQKNPRDSHNSEQSIRNILRDSYKSSTLEETAAQAEHDNLQSNEAVSSGDQEDHLKKIKPHNIKDKSNTFCNVCDVSYSSRILFLSHCSSVHDVKFKGKAGQPLVIPSDKNEKVSPPQKKIKLNQESPVKPDNNTDTPGSSKRTSWACGYCEKSFSSRSNKERHQLVSCKVRLNIC